MTFYVIFALALFVSVILALAPVLPARIVILILTFANFGPSRFRLVFGTFLWFCWFSFHGYCSCSRSSYGQPTCFACLLLL